MPITTEELHDTDSDTRFVPSWQIDNWFTYHPPTDPQIECYARIRDEAREFAHMLNRVIPEGPDKTVALRSLRTTVMLANSAIACA